MRHLDKLNTLLAQQAPALQLPTFRAKVGDSMNNLAWLRKHVSPRLTAEHAELQSLLAKSEKELKAPLVP